MCAGSSASSVRVEASACSAASSLCGCQVKSLRSLQGLHGVLSLPIDVSWPWKILLALRLPLGVRVWGPSFGGCDPSYTGGVGIGFT